MEEYMTRKTPAALILLMALSGCQARAPQTPEDTGEMPYGKWQFDFFTPHALPAFVTRALIIDSEDVVYTFNTLDRARLTRTLSAPGITEQAAGVFVSTKRAIHRP
jgi:hypothetical protein